MLKHVTVAKKIGVMLIPLVAGLVYFAALDVIEKMHLASDARTTQALAQLAVKSSAIIHELQKERGLTAGFIASKAAKFTAELSVQREQSDMRIRELKAFAAQGLQDPGGGAVTWMKESLAKTGTLLDTRNKVSGLALTGAQSFSFYTELINSFMNIISSVSKSDINKDISRKITAYQALVREKEEAGKERATLNAVFSANSFVDETYRRFLGILSAQKVYGDLFAIYASEAEMRAYMELKNGEAAKRVTEMRDTAISRHAAGDFGIEPAVWFKTMTARIDVMKGLEELFSSDIIALTAKLEKVSRARLAISAVIALLLLGFSVVTAFFVTLSIVRPLKTVLATLKQIANGDLTARARLDSRDEMGMLARGLNEMGEKVGEAMHQVAKSAELVLCASSELRVTSEQMATGTEEVASQTSAVATASEEMSATSNDIARSCLNAAEGSRIAANSAHCGSSIVLETVEGMSMIAERVRQAAQTLQNLGRRSEQIGEIASTIEEIADQTNLLALNAAIEAARAGEHGRGFAVVADEVKILAERTAKATKEIGAMIKAIQCDTILSVKTMEDGVKAVEEGSVKAAKSGQALEDILGQINGVTMQVSQIATATEQQTATTGEIAHNIHQISTGVQMTAQGVQVSATAASSLAILSDELRSLISRFRYEEVSLKEGSV